MIEKDDIKIGGYPKNPGKHGGKYFALFEVIESLPIVRNEDLIEGWASIDCEDTLATDRIKASVYQRYYRGRNDINYTVQVSSRKNENGIRLWFRRIFKEKETG